ncbi:MAG TPA: ABC transporter ATP-binding protein [Actinomycetota bacterium]|nr:ABC transporter ATP-binding protein [Actinomycetota bacterium]
MPVLRAQKVTLSFAGIQALVDVSFDVNQHELFAVIGPNGAGKTSLLNCLSGLYRPDGGYIDFLGEDILNDAPEHIARRGMARMFQNVELFENLTVLDNLMLGRYVHVGYGTLSALVYAGRAKRDEIRNRRIVEELIDFLEIEQYRKQPVGLLPYGIKKRIELGRALAMEPKLLLLDEPVAGMNLEETEDMARFILDIREELAIAMILVEHDMGVVMDLADRILALDFGRCIALGTPSEIQRDEKVIRAYLGSEGGGR